MALLIFGYMFERIFRWSRAFGEWHATMVWCTLFMFIPKHGEMIQFELLFFAIGVFNWNSLPFPSGALLEPNSVRYLQLVTSANGKLVTAPQMVKLLTSWVYPRPTIQKEGNEQSHSGTRFHESLGWYLWTCHSLLQNSALPKLKENISTHGGKSSQPVEIVKTSPKTAAENWIFTKHQLVIVGLCPSTQYLWLLHWHPFDPLIGTLGHLALPLRRRFDDAMSNDLSGLRQIRQGRRLEVWKRKFLLKQ